VAAEFNQPRKRKRKNCLGVDFDVIDQEANESCEEARKIDEEIKEIVTGASDLGGKLNFYILFISNSF
jgi:hypothetical protein